MKKFYLFFSLLLVGYLSQAQIGKGTILLGGSLSVGSSSDNQSANGVAGAKITSSSVGLSPSIGLAVQNNLVLGLHLIYDHQDESQDTVSSSKANDYGLGVFLRRYKYLGDRFYFFGESDLNFIYEHSRNGQPGDLYSSETKTSLFSLGFAPGVAYSLT